MHQYERKTKPLVFGFARHQSGKYEHQVGWLRTNIINDIDHTTFKTQRCWLSVSTTLMSPSFAHIAHNLVFNGRINIFISTKNTKVVFIFFFAFFFFFFVFWLESLKSFFILFKFFNNLSYFLLEGVLSLHFSLFIWVPFLLSFRFLLDFLRFLIVCK